MHISKTTIEQTEDIFQKWQKQQALLEQTIPLVGQLFRNKGIILLMYGRPLIHQSPMEILKLHDYVSTIENTPFSIFKSFPILEKITKMKLSCSRIDLGKLTIAWMQENEQHEDNLNIFLNEELQKIPDLPKKYQNAEQKPRDIVLYGFGRIGRLVARLLMERAGNDHGMRLRAIVVRKPKIPDLKKRASLLMRDSVHGFFQGQVTIDEDNNALIINGQRVHLIYSSSPSEVDYTAYGIHDAIVCDNTGIWRDEKELSAHLQSKGTQKVLLTAPGKGSVKNIVCGVNSSDMSDQDSIVSAASCTTNAIVPVLKSLNDKFGVKNGHIETVHSYTNDQNLIDNFHKADRRGRSAALNMVLTSTGAAKAVAKALPEFEGKLTGNAIRVPTPNVSMAILNLNLEQETSVEELNNHLKWAATHSKYQLQIGYTTSTEVVSTDLVGARHAGVVDSLATIVEGTRAVIYIWYDNEFGYSVQVTRLLQRMAGIHYPSFPAVQN